MQRQSGGIFFGVCVECGSSSSKHWLVWIASTLDLTLARTVTSHRFLSFYSDVVRKSAALLAPVISLFFKSAVILRIISLRDDIEKTHTLRSRVVWEEARRRGIPMRQLFVLGLSTELFEAYLQNSSHIFLSLPVPLRYRADEPWVDDKYMLKKKFAEGGVAAPLSYSVSTFKEAREALARLGTVCVKPRFGSNGRHTFPYVSTEEELAKAFYSAKKICYWVVVEEHLEGNISRATCVNGTLVGFLESQYPTVVGDGHSTIRELIEKENLNRPARVEEIELTPVHTSYIARRGYSADSVLEADKILPLTYRAGYGSGGRNWERGTDINPELRQEIERAARVTRLPVVGFDLIIQNPHQSPQGQRWGIIEANSLPWIDLHSSPLYGTPQNVAAHIWDLWK